MVPVSTTYEPLIVGASAAIAVVGPLVGINAILCARDSNDRIQWAWLLLGVALFAVCGMWAANFAGLLAFDVDKPITFDSGMTGLSLIAPIVFTTLALMMVTRTRVSHAVMVLAAVTMTMGIAAMHYGSVSAMRLPAKVGHEPMMVTLSIAVCFLAALAALYWFRIVTGIGRYVAAVPMALAVLGLHYICMEGASFKTAQGQVEYFEGALTESILAGWVIATTAGAVVAGIILAFLAYVKGQMAQADQRVDFSRPSSHS